jgi:DNA-binding response OmpR family regulator
MNTSRLLLVEDDDDVAEIVIEILDSEGYQVDRAADGAEGLISLRTGEMPSLVLLDWTLPKVSGPEMARTMQRELGWSRIPIVLLTASDEAKDKALALKAWGYLKKPVDPNDLVRMVDAIVREPTTLRSGHPGLAPTFGRVGSSEVETEAEGRG